MKEKRIGALVVLVCVSLLVANMLCSIGCYSASGSDNTNSDTDTDSDSDGRPGDVCPALPSLRRVA